VRDSYSIINRGASVSLIGKDKQWIITAVEVTKNHRGEGHARSLMKAVCQDADEEGVTLLLSVSPSEPEMSKPRLRRFYSDFGFTGMIEDEDAMIRLPKGVKTDYDLWVPIKWFSGSHSYQASIYNDKQVLASGLGASPQEALLAAAKQFAGQHGEGE
jgi:predicted GNAT family acetyltransferase